MVKHTIDHYISNLLYINECVVVPGFGAFLTRYFPAEVNAATHMFRPPSKRVAFNARIQENDGLLAQHIVKTESVSFEKAMESIEISVRSWKSILRSGKKVNLTGIGRLYMSDSGKLQFNPAHDINYDINAYGLNIFRANAMDREQEIKRSVNKAIEKHQSKKSAPKSKSKPAEKTAKVRSLNLRPWVGVLGPVAALLLVGAYVYTNPGTANTVKEQVSGIFRLDSIVSPSVENQSIASSESAIGFNEAQRLNGDYGPEDDVLSEQEEASKTEYTSAPEQETEINSSEQDVETPEELAIDSDAVSAFHTLEETSADKAMATPVNEDYSAGEDDESESISEMLEDNFFLPEKPLYNVKKRPEGSQKGYTPSQSSSEKTYQSASSGSLVNYQRAKSNDKAQPEKTNNEPSRSKKLDNQKPIADKAPAERTSQANNTQKVASKTIIATEGYQIVVGAFGSLNNATNYVERLKAEGWSAYTYKSGNLNRVAIGSVQSEQQAQKLLSQVKQLVNANAWVNQL